VTIRREFGADERFAAVVITNQNEALFLHRDKPQEIVKHDGPVKVTLPIFIRITARNVDGEPGIVDFTGEISKDGSRWDTLSAVTKIQMDTVPNIDLKAGLTVSAQTGPNDVTAPSQAHAIFSRVPGAPRAGGSGTLRPIARCRLESLVPSGGMPCTDSVL
jgi:hypothetical protein